MAVFERYDSADHRACDDQCGDQNSKPCVFELKHLPYPKVGKREREEHTVNTEKHVPYRMLGMLVIVAGVIVGAVAISSELALSLVVVVITLTVAVIFVIVVVHVILLSARLRAT